MQVFDFLAHDVRRSRREMARSMREIVGRLPGF